MSADAPLPADAARVLAQATVAAAVASVVATAPALVTPESTDDVAACLCTVDVGAEIERLRRESVMSSDIQFCQSFYTDVLPAFAVHANNIGDSFCPPRPSRGTPNCYDVEVGVVREVARRLEMDDPVANAWGYCTSGGSEGNVIGVYQGRERFASLGDQSTVLVTSSAAHYSIPKAGRILRMPIKMVAANADGTLSLEALEAYLLAERPSSIVLVCTLGTVMSGAYDDVHGAIAVCERCGVTRDRRYVHIDGALGGPLNMLWGSGVARPAQLDGLPLVNFRCAAIDSLSFSIHKLVGCPVPAGCFVTRMSSRVVLGSEYVSKQDGTLLGSRSGVVPLYLAQVLSTPAMLAELRAQWLEALDTAAYMVDKLKAAGVDAWRPAHSFAVCMPAPTAATEWVSRKWMLLSNPTFAHYFCMRHSRSIARADAFIADLVSALREPSVTAAVVSAPNVVPAVQPQ